MDVRQLRYFLAVVEQRNFTKAAEAVHVSQPSLSFQIAALESELGTPLFNRLRRMITLTEAGKILHIRAERICRELDQTVQEIRELNGSDHGRLMVGTLSTLNLYLISPLIGEFRRCFPEVQLHVHALQSTEIVQALLADRLDIGFCSLPVPDKRIITTRLFDENLFLVAPADFSFPRRRIQMRQLAEFPLVLFPGDYCLRKMIETECAKAGVRPKVVVEMTSPEGILDAVRHGIGLTVLPELYIHQQIRNSGLRSIALYEPVPRHTVGVAYLANRHMSRAALELVRICSDIMNKLDAKSEEIVSS